jgi:ABC-type Fe3+/spermidine/putrescine transport system ATPase subunit
MGPSGSGKTTLLSVIGGRVNNDNVKGKITYNDVPYSPVLKRRLNSFF